MSLISLESHFSVSLLMVVFLLTLGLTSFVILTYWRERRRGGKPDFLTETPARGTVSLLELRSTPGSPSAPELTPQQIQLLRTALLPELSEFIKQNIVQSLASQRDALVSLQHQAHQSVVDLESRLSALQAPLQDRIRAYEIRISELERELVAQNCDMRNLTREMLLLTRQKLAEEVEHVARIETPKFNLPPQ